MAYHINKSDIGHTRLKKKKKNTQTSFVARPKREWRRKDRKTLAIESILRYAQT